MYETETNDELQPSIITIFGSEKHLQNCTNEVINETTIYLHHPTLYTVPCGLMHNMTIL